MLNFQSVKDLLMICIEIPQAAVSPRFLPVNYTAIMLIWSSPNFLLTDRKGARITASLQNFTLLLHKFTFYANYMPNKLI